MCSSAICGLMKAVDYMQKHKDWTKKYFAKYAGEKDPIVLDQAYPDVIMKIRTDGLSKSWMENSLAW